jgi:hypothetical protein
MPMVSRIYSSKSKNHGAKMLKDEAKNENIMLGYIMGGKDFKATK